MGRPKKVKTEETKKVEPILLDCGKPIDGMVWKGETFEITKTNQGILYHAYGGYNIFVAPNSISLYETLDDLIENKEQYEKLTGKEKEEFELSISAIFYVMNIPAFAFSSADMTYNIATAAIKALQESFDRAMNEPLKEETVDDVKDNIEFQEAVIGLENVKEALKEEVKD